MHVEHSKKLVENSVFFFLRRREHDSVRARFLPVARLPRLARYNTALAQREKAESDAKHAASMTHRDAILQQVLLRSETNDSDVVDVAYY